MDTQCISKQIWALAQVKLTSKGHISQISFSPILLLCPKLHGLFTFGVAPVSPRHGCGIRV